MDTSLSVSRDKGGCSEMCPVWPARRGSAASSESGSAARVSSGGGIVGVAPVSRVSEQVLVSRNTLWNTA